MTELSNAVGRGLVESISSLVKPESNGETRRGDVTRVDPDGRTWVRIEGNDFDTCCVRSSVACKPGDSVSVSLRNNRATIEGNYTSPATDDSKAEEAIRTGSSAQQTADMAHELATNAIADAQATRDAAERAEADANRAAESARQAAGSAKTAADAAIKAEGHAADAAASAFSANESAESAYLAALGSITSLGTVENVIESLRWLKDNPAYKKCPEGKYVDPTCDYYQIVDGEYVKVENPTVEGIPTYYVIDATATAAAYVDSKLAVTDAGLYVTKDKLLTWADGDEMPDGSGTIGAPELDEEGNPVLDDEGNPVIIGADLIGRPKPQEAGYVLLGVDGVTIYSKEGYPVATYGSSMKLGYGASSTTIESDMIEVIRTDIPTKVEYNVFAAGRRLANPEQPESSTNPMLPFVQFSDGYGNDLFTVDSTGKAHFAVPVPIEEGGTSARTVEGARANLGVPSIAKGGSYWGLGFPDGTNVGYLRTPSSGLIPRMEGGVENTYLGTSGWPFYQCHAKEFYGTWSGNVISTGKGGTGTSTGRLLATNVASSWAASGNTPANAAIQVQTKMNGSSAYPVINVPCSDNSRIVLDTLGYSWYFGRVTSGQTDNKLNGVIQLDCSNGRVTATDFAGTWSGGTIPVGKGGTGITSNPSMLVNLGSTTADSVFKASPRPGVTGTLPLSHGGLGATSAAGGRSMLGLTYEGVYGAVACANASSYYTDGKSLSVCRRGTCAIINMNGLTIHGGMTNNRTTVATVPSGYRPAASCYVWPILIETGGAVKIDFDGYSGDQTFWNTITYPVG